MNSAERREARRADAADGAGAPWPPAAVPDVVRDYFGFIDAFGARISDGAAIEPPASPLLDALPGLGPLLSTFPVASETARHVARRRIEDWNPLGQRLLLPDSAPAPASLFETEFSLLPMAAQTLIEWAHEAVHILAVEPWCAGATPLDTEAAFRDWYLAAEGLAFWYADIVVTREIRRSVPGAELVYARASVSNSGFHPEEAFRRAGVAGTGTLLDLYVGSFLGRDAVLERSPDLLAATYGARLRDFHGDSRVTLAALWNVIAEQGFPDRFWRRFCAIPGLPSLLSGPAPADVRDALGWIGREVLPGLAALPVETIEAVRTRRAAQIRAWHGWSLRWVLERGWCYGTAPLDVPALRSTTEEWLDQLERALRVLAAGDRSGATALLARADAFYASDVQAPLAAAGASTRYRYWLFPFFPEAGGVVGLWDARSAYRPEEAEAVLRFVGEKAGWSPAVILAQAEALVALGAASSEPERARAAFNDAMLAPGMREVWSIALGEISPAGRRFRELAFEFH